MLFQVRLQGSRLAHDGVLHQDRRQDVQADIGDTRVRPLHPVQIVRGKTMKRKIRHIPVRFVKTYYMNGMRIDLYVDGDSEDGRFSVRDKEVKITIGIGNMSWANALGVLMHEVVELMWHCERCRYAKTRKGSDSIDGLIVATPAIGSFVHFFS
jgi:hypothetical protein